MGWFGWGRKKSDRSISDVEPVRAISRAEERRGSELEKQAEMVRGKHFTEWVPVLDKLRAEKEDDEALELILECIDATERGSRFDGREPAPGYTKRASVIYRRRKDYASEIAIIERWQAACPPERRGPGATQADLEKRLSKARELLTAQTQEN